MVDFVDIQYARHLAARLDNFRIRSTNPYKINFRCPLCGDSQKSRSKARGWLLERDNSFFYYCHNCGASQSFAFFLKNVDPLSYNNYIAEKFIKKDNQTKLVSVPQKFDIPKTHKNDPLKLIKKVSQLEWDHPIKKYIQKRQIPANQHYKLYYAGKFKTWINQIIPDKFSNPGKDEPRLVIPFLDKYKKVFGVSARGFDPNGIRYITIMFEDRPKIFGLDTVDFNKQYYVVEGAIDSLFIQNAVAMAGADVNLNALENIQENAIFVFDAEPRNKEIHKRMEKVIDSGYKICIWPTNMPGKDINEMYLNGLTNIANTIKQNTYKGLEAKLKFTEWRKT